jgi:hypothetical protein
VLGPEELQTRTGALRKRLCDPSWFMRALNECIARRANREDGRKGHFWEGRFKSIHLLDAEAVLQCAMYIDLNEIRAGLAQTPETSEHSSVHSRILVKRMHQKRRGERARAPRNVDHLIAHPAECDPHANPMLESFRSDEAGIWLTPIECAPLASAKPRPAAGHRRGMFDMTLDHYLALVDSFGRIIKAGTGAIAAHLKPILERLRVDPDHLTAILTKAQRLYGTVAGAPALVKREAERRKRSRAVSVFGCRT